MQGSLRLHAGVLYVGRHELTAEVASYDLDGRPLETRFRFRDEHAGRSTVDGIDVDADRRLWIADGAARRVRCFTLFGQEVASVGGGESARDARGELGVPVDVRVTGADDDLTLLVASGDRRRHALQVLHPAGGRGRSIPPLGDPEGRFERVRGLDHVGGELAVCEAGARRVQVFEGDLTGRLAFRFAFEVPEALGRPEAVALVGDGRVVVATRGEASNVVVFDAAGRPLQRIAQDAAGPSAHAFGDATVDQPSALALDPGSSDRDARLCVLDREGERVQVVSLDGRSFGAILGFGEA
ncbi:MAG: hypothetical protein AAGB93_10620 [Planctomycetota bacterium]